MLCNRMDQDIEQKIRDRAYQLWQQAGSPLGRDDDFWLQAHAEHYCKIEAELDQAGEDSFPASDSTNFA